MKKISVEFSERLEQIIDALPFEGCEDTHAYNFFLVHYCLNNVAECLSDSTLKLDEFRLKLDACRELYHSTETYEKTNLSKRMLENDFKRLSDEMASEQQFLNFIKELKPEIHKKKYIIQKNIYRLN